MNSYTQKFNVDYIFSSALEKTDLTWKEISELSKHPTMEELRQLHKYDECFSIGEVKF